MGAMMKTWVNQPQNKQRGIGFAGVMLVIAGLLFALILAMKIVPPYLHNMQIERIFKVIVNDPEMPNAAVKEIRASYTKRATMDYIDELTAEDVEVGKDGGHISLSAKYSVKIPMAGNVSLVIDFTPHAEK